MKPQNYIRMEFPSLPSNVGLARVSVASFASQLDFNLSELEEIRVAISEAVSNCVIHAYPDEIGLIELTASINQGMLEISVNDSGKGIEDIVLARTPAYSSNPERMGLGLVFMESFMDQMEITSKPDQGTKITMKKRPENKNDEPIFS
jgi:stage II sporulation protein AB (anti-sigma F factor)